MTTNLSNLVGRFFVETVGYHKGETFECTNVVTLRDGVYMAGFWACGSYSLELIRDTLQEITA